MVKRTQTKKMVYLSLMAAFAIVLGYIETLFPLPTIVPYIKLGLGNVIVVSVMYIFGLKDAFFVSIMKILATSLLFSGFAALPYSLAGGLLSLLTMAFLKRSSFFGIIGVSVAGGALHMLGQILVASVIVENIGLSFFLAPLLAAGAGTGIFVGAVSGFIVNRFRRTDITY